MAKKILFDAESVHELAISFGCTENMIRYSLKGERKGELAQRIRKRTLDIGLREKGDERITILN